MSITQYVKGLFPNETPYRFTSSSGVSVGAGPFAGGVGALYINSSSADDHELDYILIGGSLGPLPASVEVSTADFWSQNVGHIYSTTSDDLTFDDMKGMIATIGVASNGPCLPDGLAIVIYFMGLPFWALGYLAATTNPTAILQTLSHARAMGIMIGHYKGIDCGFSVQFGHSI